MGFVTLRRNKNGDKRNAEVFAFTNEEIARMYRSTIPTPLRTKCCSRIGSLDKEKIGVTNCCRDEDPMGGSGKKSKKRQGITRKDRKTETSPLYLGKGRKDTLGVKPATVRSERLKLRTPEDGPPPSHGGPRRWAHGPACVKSERPWPALRSLLARIKELFWIRNSSSSYRAYRDRTHSTFQAPRS
ncbi:hypothetical protein GE061_015952 [Apolygus lucorum]|uniref:Uncharacterized protein n=1 Tax=Apolygus lucorum TaxID=248454 RepID=A0A8S9XHH1_APOLU|nr:hypothetical protein GE061_015952 [Apolygus lucorum]